MDRPPYMMLLLVAVVLGIILIWGIYTKLTSSSTPAPSIEPSSQPTLLERMQDRLAATRASTAPSTHPTTRRAADLTHA